jgi:hypothetical protein
MTTAPRIIIQLVLETAPVVAVVVVVVDVAVAEVVAEVVEVVDVIITVTVPVAVALLLNATVSAGTTMVFGSVLLSLVNTTKGLSMALPSLGMLPPTAGIQCLLLHLVMLL